MTELNAGQKNLLSYIDKYQNLVGGVVEKIQDYIYSWKTTPKEELPHFDSWPESITQEQSHWIVSDFITALIYANVPDKVINAVKEANNILLGFRELSGFDEHLNYGNLDEKKIAPLYCVRDLLNEFIYREILKDVQSDKAKNKTDNKDLAGEQKKEDKQPLQPLREKARLIYEKLLTLEPHEAMTLPKIQDWLYETNEINLDEGTWKEIRKELIPYGLKNRPRIGYYIEKK